jgi:hypothetical protein
MICFDALIVFIITVLSFLVFLVGLRGVSLVPSYFLGVWCLVHVSVNLLLQELVDLLIFKVLMCRFSLTFIIERGCGDGTLYFGVVSQSLTGLLSFIIVIKWFQAPLLCSSYLKFSQLRWNRYSLFSFSFIISQFSWNRYAWFSIIMSNSHTFCELDFHEFPFSCFILLYEIALHPPDLTWVLKSG